MTASIAYITTRLDDFIYALKTITREASTLTSADLRSRLREAHRYLIGAHGEYIALRDAGDLSTVASRLTQARITLAAEVLNGFHRYVDAPEDLTPAACVYSDLLALHLMETLLRTDTARGTISAILSTVDPAADEVEDLTAVGMDDEAHVALCRADARVYAATSLLDALEDPDPLRVDARDARRRLDGAGNTVAALA